MSGRLSDVFTPAASLEEERDSLRRRLSALDQELFARGVAEREELARRITVVERNLDWLALHMGLVPAGSVSAPNDARSLQPPTPTPVAAVSPVSPAASEPVLVRETEPESPAALASAPLPQGATPRIVGERALSGASPLYTWTGDEWVVAEWVPEGTPLPVTGRMTAERTEVFFGRRLLWVENEQLTPREPLLAPRAEPAPQAELVPPTPPARRTPPRPPVWTRPGFVPKLMALVGAAVTLIGVAFLLILAAQMGYYDEKARTISAAVLAGVLVWLAFVVRRRDPDNVGAPILAATGVASAYLSVVAATVIYQWLPPMAGVVLAAVVGLAGLVLARRWDNQWVALVAVLGSLLLAPFIGSSQIEPTVTLMLVVTAVTLYFEHESGWRLFPFARVLPTNVMLLLLAGNTPVGHPNFTLLVGMTVALAWLGLVSAVIAPAESAEPGVKDVNPITGQLISIGLMVPMVLPVTLAGVRITEPWSAAAILSLVAVPMIVVGLRPTIHERVRWAAVPLGAGLLLLAGLAATQQRYLGIMALAFGTVYLAVAVKTRSKVNLIVGAILGVAGVVGWLPLVSGFLLQSVAVRQGPEQIVQSLVGIAAVVLGGLAARTWLGELSPRMLYGGWSLGIAMGSIAIVFTGAWAGVQTGNAEAGFQGGHTMVTIAWMLLCIVFLRRGLATKRDAKVWLRLAQAIAGLAVAKLFLFDLSALAAIARVGAFLVAGLLLLFVGTRYAKAWERVHGTPDADGVEAATEPPDRPEPAEPLAPTESETVDVSGAPPASFERPA